MNEFFNWVYNIIHEKKEWEYDTFKITSKVPSKEKFVERYQNKFLHPSLCDVRMIEQMYDWLDDEMRIRVFYKANLRGFLSLRKISDLYSDIACSDVEFIDPNKIPKELEKPIKYLTSLVVEFVVYKYSMFRYEDRTKYFNRAVAIVIDRPKVVSM